METVYYIGMDVHKNSVRIAVLKDSEMKTEFERTVENDTATIVRILDGYVKKGTVIAAYEAGCLGYTLYRLDSRSSVYATRFERQPVLFSSPAGSLF